MSKELSFQNHERGLEVAKALLDEHYVVMLSYEEHLLIINYEYSPLSNRSDVVFMSQEVYEEELDKAFKDIAEDIAEDIKKEYNIYK